MNIKEYVKIQAEKCENAVMKEIFIDLVDTFYPKPVKKTVTTSYSWNPVSKETKTANDNFYKRKVRIQNMPNGKPSIGLINEDGFDIKLPKQEKLEWVLCDEKGVTYYYGLNRVFFKTKDSRIVYMVNKSNYNAHRANVETIRDYVLENGEVIEVSE
jgi:hypothetical protein